MELAQDGNLGVFSLSAAQWCQSISVCASQLPQQGLGHLGNWLQPFAANAEFPSSASEASAAASGWLSFLCHAKVDTAFPQPIPRHFVSLQARAKFVLASLHIWIVIYANLVPRYVECMVLPGRVKTQVFTRKEKKNSTYYAKAYMTWCLRWKCLKRVWHP